MALLDKLWDSALDQASDPERQKEWVEKGFDSALEEGKKLLPPGGIVGNDLRGVRASGDLALAKLEEHKAKLVGLGANGLKATLVMVANGQYVKAAEKAATVLTTASWIEVGDAMLGQAEAGNQAKRDADKAKAEFLDMLKDIGVACAKAALALLIAVI